MDNRPAYTDLILKIAELERTNELLRKNSNRLKRVSDIANLGILEWCSTSGAIYFNSDFQNMTGLTQKELNTFTFDFWLTRLHPGDRKKGEQTIKSLFNGKAEQIKDEYRIRHPEKEWVWLYEASRVIARDSEGFPLCIISVYQDISSRKHIEEELSKVKATLENILDSVIPICVTNMQYEILLTNKSYDSIFGKPAPGMRCFESRSGPACHTDDCPNHQIQKGADIYSCEVLKKENGNSPDRTFIVTARPYFDAHHEVIGFVESFQDITRRTHLEAEKNQLIDKLQTALAQVKQLSGFLPICASCKKIRDDKGYWNQIETYIKDHSEAEFSHGLCPECAKKLYPELDLKKNSG